MPITLKELINENINTIQEKLKSKNFNAPVDVEGNRTYKNEIVDDIKDIIINKLKKKYFGRIEKFLLIDVGCGQVPQFINELANKLKKQEKELKNKKVYLFGIEPFLNNTIEENGLIIKKILKAHVEGEEEKEGFFNKIETGIFDLITEFNVMKYSIEMIEFLKEVTKGLKKDGLIMLTVPCDTNYDPILFLKNNELKIVSNYAHKDYRINLWEGGFIFKQLFKNNYKEEFIKLMNFLGLNVYKDFNTYILFKKNGTTDFNKFIDYLKNR